MPLCPRGGQGAVLGNWFSSYHVGFEDQTQVIRNRYLHLLVDLTDLVIEILRKYSDFGSHGSCHWS